MAVLVDYVEDLTVKDLELSHPVHHLSQVLEGNITFRQLDKVLAAIADESGYTHLTPTYLITGLHTAKLNRASY